MRASEIAQVCHEANRALQAIQADPSVPVGPPWAELDAETAASAVSGVQAILDNPSRTAAESHDGWTAFKVERGWVYGPVKDDELKEHPCLVSYDQLPEGQRIKDSLFGAIVRALA